MRIGRAIDIQEEGFQSVFDIEVEFADGRIVQHVPSGKAQGVGSLLQGRNAKAYRSFLITAKVKLEVFVQRIGLGHLSVNHQLQVVANTTA